MCIGGLLICLMCLGTKVGTFNEEKGVGKGAGEAWGGDGC